MSKIYRENYYESEEIDEPMIIPITLDDGTEVECEVLVIYPVDDKQYIALMPLDESMEDVFLYRFIPQGEEEFELGGIDDDEEYEAVVDVFEMLLDDADFDEMMDDDKED